MRAAYRAFSGDVKSTSRHENLPEIAGRSSGAARRRSSAPATLPPPAMPQNLLKINAFEDLRAGLNQPRRHRD
jgi:hypothetical protein